jgi:RNA polymerase subunit RPABC4/transcription elongation factor Spt4
MSLVRCSECGKQVSSQAASCPHCGISPVTARRDLSWIGRVALLIAAIWAVAKCASMDSGSPGSLPVASSPLDAPRGACMLFIKRQLHDPGSADFEDATLTVKDGDVWTVRRAVRAKNAFGALRLQQFECKIRERGDKLDLVSLTPLS